MDNTQRFLHPMPHSGESFSLMQSTDAIASKGSEKNGKRRHLKFTGIEDVQLSSLVRFYGDNRWDLIAERMPNRNPRQCRDRWQNYLSPNVTFSEWTDAEDSLLLSKVTECGKRWVFISKFFPGRTDTQLKNRFRLVWKRSQQKHGELKSMERGESNTDPQRHVVNV